ncbi:MAG: GxxExxY protein [Bacteroidales bacterium]|nr:GxxExxY protein [Bacteroidales bacterium]
MVNYKQYEDVVYEIIGAAMAVHRTLGSGLLEGIYAECLHLELLDNGIENVLEKEVNCYYKSHLLEKKYRIDMAVGDICIELKSVEVLSAAHRAQLFNYLRLTRMPLGLLINFGAESLEGERYAYIKEKNFCCRLDKNMEFVD